MATVPPQRPAPAPKPAPPQRAATPPARPAQAAAPAAGAPPARPPQAARAAAAPVARAAAPRPAPAAAAAPPAAPPPGDQGQEHPAHGGRFLIFNAAPSWMVSMLVHAIFFLIAPFIYFSTGNQDKLTAIMMPQTPTEEEAIEEFKLDQPQPIDVQNVDLTSSQVVANASPIDTSIDDVFESVSLDKSLDPPDLSVQLSDFGERTAPKAGLTTQVGVSGGTGVSGRAAGMRGQMLSQYGGTAESEAAVAAALKWLALHQRPDGSWSFDHRFNNTCRGQCGNHGSLDKDVNAATALALLPFLGAGQTHMEGDYKNNVKAGLLYLMMHQKPDGSLNAGGNMYSHGLCAIALSEAYAMSNDPSLMPHAQGAINFISYAQDPVGGGWRYSPHQPGDTSVVGWQLMGLKSAHMGYLTVGPDTIKGAVRFLDNVQTDSGSFYGYTTPGKGQATTAVGLLCRMYTGWDRQNPALVRGVEYLSKLGPSKSNMYYNYYATQVMRHYEGDEWEKWNSQMRDWLVAQQGKKGHETGSWYMDGDHHGARAGRLYHTTMSTMILEVYYRHMPIYAKAASTEDFPL